MRQDDRELNIISNKKSGKRNKAYNDDDYEEYVVEDADEVYEEVKLSRRDKKKLAKKKKRKKLILLVGEIFAILVLSFVLVMLLVPNSKQWLLSTPVGKFFVKLVMSEGDYDNIHDKDFNRDNVDVNSGLDTSAMEGYYNIALFGLDSREGELEGGVNADSIIIVSIHEETGEVKLCSVYRDSWVRVAKKDGSYDYNKINSAYINGGAQAAVKTLNANFDLNISDYASINFGGLATIIDLLGGIDINISSREMYMINQYLTETRKVTGMYAPDVYQYGDVHLSGLQAVAFCRIRSEAFTDEDGTVYYNDFGRTARQRRIIMKIVDLAKNAGLTQVMNVADEVFNGDSELIYTSIPYDELIDLIPTLLNFSITGTTGYPFTLESTEVIYSGDREIDWPVCICGLAYNNYKMHEFLFNDKKYKPSETVKMIDDTLYGMLGYEEKRLDGDENIDLD